MGYLALVVASEHRILRGHAVLDPRRIELVNAASFGRSPTCDVHIEADDISRKHLVIWPLDGAWWLRAHDFSSGTFVNGVRVKHERLRPGDRIVIGGGCTFVVERV